MKQAVSVSISSSKRDKAVEIDLLGEKVRIQRIGTDGDIEKAARLYQELDGTVDAFGVGGTNLGLKVDQKTYPLYSVQPMFRFVKKTPLVDGGGLKNTLEVHLAQYIEKHMGDYIQPKRVLITSGADRWGMVQSFLTAKYDCLFGDLMFGLGIPIPLRTERAMKILAALILPIAGRLPFKWLYPIGESQEVRKPKWTQHFLWAKVVAGDCHYIARYMPDQLPDKVIVTNTTTQDDVDLFRQAGVKYLITSTPVFDGRSFGTNMMEAALVAATGKDRPLTEAELVELIDRLGLEPQLRELN
jgi:hypothetical protein